MTLAAGRALLVIPRKWLCFAALWRRFALRLGSVRRRMPTASGARPHLLHSFHSRSARRFFPFHLTALRLKSLLDIQIHSALYTFVRVSP